MFFPIGTDCQQRRFPWMNALLIALNVVIYFLYHSSGIVGHNLIPWLPAEAKYYLYPGQEIQLYQFVTYQFLHQGIYHLVGNMMFLYVFGNNLNEKLGHVPYLAFYLAGGILAGCGQVLTSDASTLGASGAIAAVAGMFMMLLPRTNVRMLVWIIFYVDVVEIPSIWFILFSVGKDLVEPYLFGQSNVAHMAHLSGYFAGFVVGAILLATHMVQRDHYDILALLARWRRRREYQHMVAQGNDPFSGTYVNRAPKAAAAPGLYVDPRTVELRDAIMAMIHTHQLSAAAARYAELKGIDSSAVLPSQDQLDIANQLMAEGHHQLAARAYEDYLAQYKTPEPPEHIQLLLGLIYSRYVPQPQRAIEMLKAALTKLHEPNRRALAEEELAKLMGQG